VIRLLLVAAVVLALAALGDAQELETKLEPALEEARRLVGEHRYQEVIELLAPFAGLTDSEARYAVAAEIGRAQFHLGRYRSAHERFREAVLLRPRRVETALYLQATAYLLGDHEQAYAIFRELIRSGATDLYSSVSLSGEGSFLADPEIWRIFDSEATELVVDLDRGALLDVAIGQTRAEVATSLGTDAGTRGEAMTARAGPHLTWVFGFDDDDSLANILLHNDTMLRYTPYRLSLGRGLDWRTRPADATSALGAPASTSRAGDDIVVMVWVRDAVRLTMEFAPPRTPTHPDLAPDEPVLRVLRLESVVEETEEALGP
jgi:tetratricopeptide (TPR) repeat protein